MKLPCVLGIWLLVGCEGSVGGGASSGARSRHPSASSAAIARPFRALDTRQGPLPGAGAIQCVQVAGRDGIPGAARAVLLNLAAVAPAGDGYLTVYPDGAPAPETSTLNYQAGHDVAVANGAIVEPGDGGRICVFASAPTHVLVDVSGYFDAADYAPLRPYRRLDTRSGPQLGAGSTSCFKVAGQDGVPGSAKAVALNLTAVDPSADGYLSSYPDGAPTPETSTLNYGAGRTAANGAIVEPGRDGAVCVFVSAATHLLVDVSGYFDAGSAFSPLRPVRRLDTRGGPQPGAGSITCAQVAGRDGVPGNAEVVAINVVAVSPSSGGYLVAYPNGAGLPETSTLNFQPGVTRANNAMVRPGADGTVCVFASQASHLLLDVVGYVGCSAETCAEPAPPPPGPPPPPQECGVQRNGIGGSADIPPVRDVAFANIPLTDVIAGGAGYHIGVDIHLSGYVAGFHNEDPFYGSMVMSHVGPISYYKVLGPGEHPHGVFIDNENENYCRHCSVGQPCAAWCDMCTASFKHNWANKVTGTALEIYAHDPDYGGVRVSVDSFRFHANGGVYSDAIGTVTLPRRGAPGVTKLNGFVWTTEGGAPAREGRFTIDIFHFGPPMKSSTGHDVLGFGSTSVNNDGYYLFAALPYGTHKTYLTDNQTGVKKIVWLDLNAPGFRIDFFLDRPCFGWPYGCTEE